MLVDRRDEVLHLYDELRLVICGQAQFRPKVGSIPNLNPFGQPRLSDNPVDQVDEMGVTRESLLQALPISAPPVRYVHALTELVPGYYYPGTTFLPVITTGKDSFRLLGHDFARDHPSSGIAGHVSWSHMQPDGVHCNTPPHLSSISVIESLFRQGKQVGDTVMNI